MESKDDYEMKFYNNNPEFRPERERERERYTSAMSSEYMMAAETGEIDLDKYPTVDFRPEVKMDENSMRSVQSSNVESMTSDYSKNENNNSLDNEYEEINNTNSRTFNLTRLQIKEIQSMLNRAGLGRLAVDGIIGYNTIQAIKRFQTANGLVSDGIIGPLTYMAINNYLNGYFKYIIKEGDTFFILGRRYGIDYRLIEAANPNVNANNLRIGTEIIIPINISVIPTDMEYTYEIMLRNLRTFKVLYPFITLSKSGESSLGRGLYYFNVGRGNNKVFYNGSHHGLEWITTPVLMKFSEEYMAKVVKGDTTAVNNYNYSTMTVMPMVNPDGVTLVLEGLKRSNPNYAELIRWNRGSTDFSRTWQANNNGVDINHNYNAGFEEYKELAAKEGYNSPGPTRYPGPYAESESETRGVVRLVNNSNFNMAIAYHTQGEVIYWRYQDINVPNAQQIGEELARAAGYTLSNTTGLSSYSGFKDWFILSKVRPGYTVEAGLGNNPLPISQFNQIYEDNKRLIQRGLERF